MRMNVKSKSALGLATVSTIALLAGMAWAAEGAGMLDASFGAGEEDGTPAGVVSTSLGDGDDFAGLRGAGHEDIGRALFGVVAHAGRVQLEGAVPDLTNAQTAMAAGIGLVARDRVGESVAPGLSIRENALIVACSQACGEAGGGKETSAEVVEG